MSFLVVVAVGPGSREQARLCDLLASLARYEQGALRRVILVDDGGQLSQEVCRASGTALPLTILPSPRKRKGDHWRGGMATNILYGFSRAADERDMDFVLKLDTDSLIIRRCSDQIAGRFDSRQNVGILGSSFRKNLFGKPVPRSTWTVNLRKWLMPIRLRRNPFPHVETALMGRNKRIRALIRDAVAEGWPLGHCAQGGGYAVSRSLLTLWERAGFLADELLWLHTDLGEDIVAALLCYAAGLEIEDFNAPGEPFGVQYRSLAFPVLEYFNRGYAVIHSLKAQDDEEERRLRQAFLHPMGISTHFGHESFTPAKSAYQ